MLHVRSFHPVNLGLCGHGVASASARHFKGQLVDDMYHSDTATEKSK
jgi:hypothetical protein